MVQEETITKSFSLELDVWKRIKEFTKKQKYRYYSHALSFIVRDHTRVEELEQELEQLRIVKETLQTHVNVYSSQLEEHNIKPLRIKSKNTIPISQEELTILKAKPIEKEED